MNLSGETNKLKLAQILLLCLEYGVPNSFTATEEDIMVKGKFERIDDYKRLRSCIDLVEDTEYAIIDYFTYKLRTCQKGQRFGEKYLRLYGLLNAIYLQVQAIIRVAELVKFPRKKAILIQMNELTILRVRHIAGAHTVNYLENNELGLSSTGKQMDYYRITQMDLHPDGTRISLVSGRNGFKQYNLNELVYEYALVSERILFEVVGKYIGSLCKHDPKTKSEFAKCMLSIKGSPTDYSRFSERLDKQRKNRFAKKIQSLLDTLDH